MVTKELLDYIELESSKGFPFGVVKAALEKQGWKTEDIDEARSEIESKLEKKTPAASIASSVYAPKNSTAPAQEVTSPIQNQNITRPAVTPTVEPKLPQYSPFLKNQAMSTATSPLPKLSTMPQAAAALRQRPATVESIEAPKNIPTTWEKAPGSHPWIRFFAILIFGIAIAVVSYLYNTGQLPWLTTFLHQI